MLTFKTMLIIGMSHSHSIASAASKQHNSFTSEHILLETKEHLKSDPERYSNFTVKHNLEEKNIDVVCLSIFGNEYNRFSITERSIPYAIGDKELSVVPNIGNRRFVTRSMFEYQAHRVLQNRNTFSIIQSLNNQFHKTKRFFLSPPPPISDGKHISKYLHIYPNQPTTTVPPKELRLKCFQIHVGIIAEYCKSIGLPFLHPPADSYDNEGFLNKAFWKDDPIHANVEYGQLVLNQIEKLL